jgi:hypothetical protein
VGSALAQAIGAEVILFYVRMLQEVAVDGNLCAIDRQRGDTQPDGIGVEGNGRNSRRSPSM